MSRWRWWRATSGALRWPKAARSSIGASARGSWMAKRSGTCISSTRSGRSCTDLAGPCRPRFC
eukprot:3146898-Prorocentrum_lima.AAC.1